MNRQSTRTLVGLFLILMGVIALMVNLNILAFGTRSLQWWFWLAVFGLGGVLFLAAFVSNSHDAWWAAIPGFTLLGLAGMTSLPTLQGPRGEGFFLGMIGLSFWVIYFSRRDFWWAIIPGGVLLTLALAASASGNGFDTGGFFFLGLGLTFLAVYLLPTPEGRKYWAIWPAAVLGIMGMLLALGSSGLARFTWPAVLIVLGGILIYRALRPRAG